MSRLDSKKLTSSGGAALLFSILAFVAAGLGMLLEPVGYIAHNAGWGIDIGVFSGKQWYTYFTAYEKHLLIFAAAFIVLVITASSFKRRRIGRETGALVTVISAIMLCLSIVLIVSCADRGMLTQTWSILLVRNLSRNMRLFDEAAAQLYYALPAVSSLMLFITGIILWVRAHLSEHAVDTPKLDDDDEIEEAASEEPKPETVIPTEKPKPETVIPTEKPKPETVIPAEKPKPETVIPTEKPKPETVIPTEKPKPETVIPTEKPKPETAIPTEKPKPETVIPTEKPKPANTEKAQLKPQNSTTRSHSQNRSRNKNRSRQSSPNSSRPAQKQKKS